MKIEFNTDTDTRLEASAIVVALIDLYGLDYFKPVPDVFVPTKPADVAQENADEQATLPIKPGMTVTGHPDGKLLIGAVVTAADPTGLAADVAQENADEQAAVAAFGAPPNAPGLPPAPFTAAAGPSQNAPAPPPVAPPPPGSTAPAPPPGSTGTAPLAPAAPLTLVDVDKSGLPWDARIHTASKAKNKTDGMWRSKPGLDPAVKAQVETELRAVMAAPPAAGAAPAAPDAPPAGFDEARARKSYIDLIGRSSAAIHGKKVSNEEVNALCAEFSVPALPMLANRLDLVGQVAAKVDALIASRTPAA